MERPEPLVIDGVRFARWGPPDEANALALWQGVYRSVEFWGAVYLTVGLLRLQPGMAGSSKVAGGLFLGFVLSALLTIVFLIGRRNRMFRRPIAAPDHAVPTTLQVVSDPHSLGFDAGMIWIEGGYLYFRGSSLELRLDRKCIRKDHWLCNAWGIRGRLSLIVPTACPSLRVTFDDLRPRRGDALAERQKRQRFLREIDTWRTLNSDAEPTLPPIELAPGGTSTHCTRARARAVVSSIAFCAAFMLLPSESSLPFTMSAAILFGLLAKHLRRSTYIDHVKQLIAKSARTTTLRNESSEAAKVRT